MWIPIAWLHWLASCCACTASPVPTTFYRDPPVGQDGRTSWRSVHDLWLEKKLKAGTFLKSTIKFLNLDSCTVGKVPPCGNVVMTPSRLQWWLQRNAWKYWGMDCTAVIVQETRSVTSVPYVVDRWRPWPTCVYTAWPCNKPDPHWPQNKNTPGTFLLPTQKWGWPHKAILHPKPSHGFINKLKLNLREWDGECSSTSTERGVSNWQQVVA